MAADNPVLRTATALISHSAGVAAVFLVLGCLATWPLVTDLNGWSVAGAADNDVFLNQYLIFWGAHALTQAPGAIYHPNMFHPARYTFAYADMLIASSVLMYPVIRLSEDPTLTYNLLLLSSIVIGGIGFWILARLLIGNHAIALAAAAMFVFNIAHFSRYRQPQHFTDHWLPWLIWSLLLWLQACGLREPAAAGDGPAPRRAWAWALGIGVLFCLQALTGSHNAVFGAMLCGGTTAYFVANALVARPKPDWRPFATGAAIILVLGALVLGSAFYPYFVERELLSAQRVSTGQDKRLVLQAGAANARDLVSAESGFYQWLGERTGWPERFVGGDLRGPVFPGAMVLILALLALLPERASPGGSRRLAAAGLDVGLLVCAAAALRALASAVPGLDLPSTLLWPALALPLLWARWAKVPEPPHAAVQLVRLLCRRRGEHPDLLLWIGAAAVCFLLMLGPAAGLYWLVQSIPGSSLIRVPRRFVLPGSFALAVLAAYGLYSLRARLAGRWPLAAVAVLGLFAIESSFVPLELARRPYSRLPLHEWLAAQEGDFAVLEMPIDTNPTAATRQMLGSVWHWKKLLISYSGSVPPDYQERMQRPARLVPLEPALAQLRQLDVRYLLVKEDRLFPQRAALVHQADSLRLVRSFDDTDVYEILPSTQAAARSVPPDSEDR